MNRMNWARQAQRVLQTPVLVWVLIGLIVPYLAFFINPIFLSGQPKMQFPEYEPAVAPIGTDMYTIIDTAYTWFADRQNPYFENGQYAYPPLNMLMVMPFSVVSKTSAYQILTLINVLGVVVMGFLIPLRLSRPRPISGLLLLALLTGLFSYGFQFELERGQFNVIAVALCMLAIWIFHEYPRWRYLAYGLLTLGAQFKFFPFIFVLLLVYDWRDWKHNLRRLILLGAINFALFFVFGTDLFLKFAGALIEKALNPYLWFGNHSIRSFSTWLPTRPGWEWLAPYSVPVTILLMTVVVSCLGLLLVQAYRQRQTGVNPMLLLACTITALTIPSDSHDYTLSFLVAPVALLFAQPDLWAKGRTPGRQAVAIVLIILFAGAYGFTLFSYAYKPLNLYHNCPPLLVMLITGTALAYLAPLPASFTPPATSPALVEQRTVTLAGSAS